MEASGQSGKVAKEDEMETLELFARAQDLSQVGGAPCPSLQTCTNLILEIKRKINSGYFS